MNEGGERKAQTHTRQALYHLLHLTLHLPTPLVPLPLPLPHLLDRLPNLLQILLDLRLLLLQRNGDRVRTVLERLKEERGFVIFRFEGALRRDEVGFRGRLEGGEQEFLRVRVGGSQ